MVVVAACTTPGVTNPDASILLAQFLADDELHNLLLTPNQQGPDAPCVGISRMADAGTSLEAACPTEASERVEFAAAIEIEAGTFVVGYGLRPKETIDTPGSIQSFVRIGPGMVGYFLVELPDSPGTDRFELVVTSPDGSTRTITSHGLSS